VFGDSATVTAVGRLENIIARNRRPNRPSEKLVVSLVLGIIVLAILFMAVCTDLGRPPVRDPPAVAPTAPDPDERGKRVDGVLLRRARPTTPTTPTTPPTPTPTPTTPATR
jgi:hypothetical protein